MSGEQRGRTTSMCLSKKGVPIGKFPFYGISGRVPAGTLNPGKALSFAMETRLQGQTGTVLSVLQLILALDAQRRSGNGLAWSAKK